MKDVDYSGHAYSSWDSGVTYSSVGVGACLNSGGNENAYCQKAAVGDVDCAEYCSTNAGCTGYHIFVSGGGTTYCRNYLLQSDAPVTLQTSGSQDCHQQGEGTTITASDSSGSVIPLRKAGNATATTRPWVMGRRALEDSGCCCVMVPLSACRPARISR